MPTARKFVNQKDAEILAQAKEALSDQRDNETNALSENRLIDEVEKRISFNPVAERRKKAERLVREAERPGKTESDGSLWFPGFEPVNYEPEQLIPDEAGAVVERDLATSHFVSASLERAGENLRRVQKAFHRKQNEADEFAVWATDQAIDGRAAREITFGNFVREKGFWRQEPLAGPADDEDGE